RNDTSSDESLSGDNISADLDMITDYSNETSDTDHSNKNNNPNRSNKKPSTKTKLRKNSSWIWQYFRRRRPSRKWKTRRNCTVIVKDKKVPNGQREYGQLVKTQGSTGNFQAHLNTHGITKPAKVVDAIEQPTISEMFHRAARQNTRQKESINYALVEWIVTDLQPFYVLKNESFIKLIHILNPYYELPSDKHIKALIHQTIITLTRNCMPLSTSIGNEELDLTNMSTIFDEEEEENIVDVDEELEIIITANRDSWERDKAIDLLREKYDLLSIGNESITSLVNVEQNENQMSLFSIMFGSN
ncbi:23074_t:CDS:2, partial [Gigaspora rosea]